jgi:hypothetical protein
MVRALDIDDKNETARLHEILNYAGSIGHIAAFIKKEGVSIGSQRAALKNLTRSLRQTIQFIAELHWQSNELVAAGYAKEEPVFTASADRISSPLYSQRDRDLAAIRRYTMAVEFAEAQIDTSSKARLGVEIRQAKYVIEAYEEFTGKPISGERSNIRGRSQAREFLELGVNHVTEGKLIGSQVQYVIRQAAEMVRQQRKNTLGVNHPSSGG